MRDFTTRSIALHIASTAVPIAFGMLLQVIYPLVDLYFLAKVGMAAIAGVSASGNAMTIVAAMVLALTPGTIAFVAQAVGRADYSDANVVFNQSLLLSVVCAFAIMVIFNAAVGSYMRSLTTDPATIEAGVQFIVYASPGFALHLPMAIFSCALRAAGIVRVPVLIYALTVLVNAALAPVLISGWGTGFAFGVRGAGLATSISVMIGTILLGVCFHRSQHRMSVVPALMRPNFGQWSRILSIGLPTAADFVALFLSTALVYYAIRNFGASAQAGYGIGLRVLQTLLVPAVALATSLGPIVGQNFGARRFERVRKTFRTAAFLGTSVMLVVTLSMQGRMATVVVGMFDADSTAAAVAVEFVQLMSLTLVLQCFVSVCIAMFQSLGSILPTLVSAAIRLVAFAIPAVWLAGQPSFRIQHVWYLLVASFALQAATSGLLLHAQFGRKLSVNGERSGQQRAGSAVSRDICRTSELAGE